ncbi:MAG TPA: HNH endonuclease signature motif containing protein [Candidatus Competibacteraceae bacterium]|nr:HNH endonuclease [Candidatus Competibacteraceae bacterium]HRY18566.1 HNH endonuclease signature motif containing protein [Candidatus Competibacteraceae bacterium]
MRLTVDFSALHAAVRQMGAQAADPEFHLGQKATTLDPIDIALSETGIDVILKDVNTDTGLLAYKGRQVLLYIQDHGLNVQKALDNGSAGRKYHVAFCKTLTEMQSKGKFERYVATNDTSGEFFISGLSIHARSPVEGKTQLNVCKNCLEYLNYQGYKQGSRSTIFSRFSLAAFFATYSSFFPHMPSRLAGENDSLYTPDWPMISGRYRADRDFRCESCSVNLSNHKNLLHTHHKNGVKTDNRKSNLQALCVDCHRKQPSHDHMSVRHADMQLITRLRREQSIVKKDMGWSEAFKLADPGVHGILYHYRSKGWNSPEVGYEIHEPDGRIIGQLELAWPFERFGIAISEEDIYIARRQGWEVLSMREAADQ